MKCTIAFVTVCTLSLFGDPMALCGGPMAKEEVEQRHQPAPDEPLISVYLQRGNVIDRTLRSGWRMVVWNDGQIAFADDWKAADPPLLCGDLNQEQMKSIRDLIDKHRLKDRDEMLLIPPCSGYSMISVYEGKKPKSFALWNNGNGMGRIPEDESWLVSFIREAQPLLEQIRPAESKPIGEVPALEERIRPMRR